MVVADGMTVSSPIDRNVTTMVTINNIPSKIPLEPAFLSFLLILFLISMLFLYIMMSQVKKSFSASRNDFLYF